ncbi:MAG: tetratricopeptide repeat protein [Ferruginibacter sp.]|nr:tetratricopeptide repeat protein [Ferruginibacter sp.]
MKSIFFTALLLVIVLVIVGANKAFNKNPVKKGQWEKQDIISCGPSALELTTGDNGKFIPVLPGWGHHGYTISTSNDSTQLYFNQGINFYYSYHFREALASFKEAARFDPTCAMAYWGQALSMGPYYNMYYYKMKKGVPAVLKLMNSYMPGANEKEKGLIMAMQQRYSTDTTNADRSKLDSNYASAMFLLTKQYNTDDDIKALYVDAVMLAHKWDFWNNNGKPKPWTTELVTLCEEILKRNSFHPAALHYYIHVTEASKHPELALHSANVLKDVLPGVGHMVHMATHMYQRNGLFTKGVNVNEEANTANNQVDSIAPHLGIGKNTILHIYAVQSYCAMNAGMYSKGMPVYMRARNRLLDLRPDIEKDAYSQYIYMMPVIAWVRLGRWQQIVQSPAPDAKWKYALVLDDFARGLAHVHSKNLKAANLCLKNIELNMNDSLLAVREMPFNKPVQCAGIAAGILKGELLNAEGRGSEAVAALRQAVAEEDELIYREPQEWLIPARQYLGAVLLQMNRPKEAEDVYREDLIANPGNGWSLLGMYNSLLAQNKITVAAKFKTGYIKAFKDADVKPLASVF